MSTFKQYRRKQIAELREYEPGEKLQGVSISEEDFRAGSPKRGDMIARNPKNHADQWLVSAAYFTDNFEALDSKKEKEEMNNSWDNDNVLTVCFTLGAIVLMVTVATCNIMVMA